MQMHSNGCLNCLLNPCALFYCIVFDINRIKLSMHLHHRTPIIIVWKCFSVKSGTSDDKFQCSLSIKNCFLHQSKQNVSIKWSLMSFVQNYDMIFEQIRISNTLSDKYTVSYVSQLCFWRCFIIKPNRVSNWLASFYSPFKTNSICHAHSCHSSRLSNDNIDFIDGWHYSFYVLFNILLFFYDWLSDNLRVHHILR